LSDELCRPSAHALCGVCKEGTGASSGAPEVVPLAPAPFAFALAPAIAVAAPAVAAGAADPGVPATPPWFTWPAVEGSTLPPAPAVPPALLEPPALPAPDPPPAPEAPANRQSQPEAQVLLGEQFALARL